MVLGKNVKQCLNIGCLNKWKYQEEKEFTAVGNLSAVPLCPGQSLSLCLLLQLLEDSGAAVKG